MTSRRRRRPRNHLLIRGAPRHVCSSGLRRRVLVSGNGRPRDVGRADQRYLAIESEFCAAKVKEGI